MSDSPLISVAICTRNRARLLEQVLDSLSSQVLEPSRWEVLVVDNASEDDTPRVTRLAAERGLAVRHVLEEATGLSYARNRAIREARGEYVGFTDDDCLLPPDWLRTAAEIIEARRPAVFGGPYAPWYASGKPAWFKDSYVDFSLGDEARELAGDRFLSGANVFFRRELAEGADLFDPGLGMRGDSIAYGEEVAVQRELLRRHPDQLHFYDPRLEVRHLVREDKMALSWRLRAAFAKGRDVYLANPEQQSRTSSRPSLATEILRTALAFGIDTLGALVRDRSRYPYWQQYLCESSGLYLRRLGRLSVQYKLTAGRPRAPEEPGNGEPRRERVE